VIISNLNRKQRLMCVHNILGWIVA